MNNTILKMQTCDQCGAKVSDQYWRVFAVEGTLHGCLNCERKAGQHGPTDAQYRSASVRG
ncbi:DUF7563 family protein [Halopiger thermotolerans]